MANFQEPIFGFVSRISISDKNSNMIIHATKRSHFKHFGAYTNTNIESVSTIICMFTKHCCYRHQIFGTDVNTTANTLFFPSSVNTGAKLDFQSIWPLI